MTSSVKAIFPYHKNQEKIKKFSKDFNLKIFPEYDSIIFEGCPLDFMEINSLLIEGVTG